MKCRFIDDYGSFLAKGHIPKTAYFPLCNKELLGAITASLCGDLKIDQEHFFLPPVSRINLTNDKSCINLWLRFPQGLFSITGVSATYLNHLWPVEKLVEASPGWFRLYLKSCELGLEAVILSFVPPDVNGQIFWVKIKSTARKTLGFEPIFVTPVYGRSADNIRDHRHVTSLLNRVRFLKNGLVVKPTMSFDEKGHRLNNTIYAVLGDKQLVDIYSYYEDVVGDGDLLNPKGLLQSKADRQYCQGKEVVAGLVFPEVKLRRSETVEFVTGLFIGEEKDLDKWQRFIKKNSVKQAYKKTWSYWKNYADKLRFDFPDKIYSNWLLWVGIQPYYRKLYGCSFLPDFDYGRGGRGWRDLWQDLLGLLLRHPEDVRSNILNNFNGVRIDGSNATIIGKVPGEFIADRNRISRVWMDHGLWPWETTKLYIDQTGDWKILFEKVRYFRDAQIFRARRYDYKWNGELYLKDAQGNYYYGTILEHILVQHLVQVLNVGDNGNIFLEDADWNDGLDMARERGESVAFTHFYAGNLLEIAELLEKIKDKVTSISLIKEASFLLEEPQRPSEKRDLLNRYFEAVQVREISGEKITISTEELIAILRLKAEHLRSHLLKNELLEVQGHKVFNGYYDNLGHRVCGEVDGRVRVTLTGQVFALMKATVSGELAREIAKSVDKFLFDEKIGGYRLNTDFGKIYPELGRAFSFAFGEKENGAVFSHMVVMYANALLRQGLVKEAEKALLSLYKLAIDSENSKVFPCLPEYFNNQKWGMYCYLTGSASWYILTLYRYLLGISSDMGDVLFYPKVSKAFFSQGDCIEVKTTIINRPVLVRIKNPLKLDWGDYVIDYIKIGSHKIVCRRNQVKISRAEMKRYLSNKRRTTIEVVLGCAE